MLSEENTDIICPLFSRTPSDFKKKMDTQLTVGWKWKNPHEQKEISPLSSSCVPLADLMRGTILMSQLFFVSVCNLLPPTTTSTAVSSWGHLLMGFHASYTFCSPTCLCDSCRLPKSESSTKAGDLPTRRENSWWSKFSSQTSSQVIDSFHVNSIYGCQFLSRSALPRIAG